MKLKNNTDTTLCTFNYYMDITGLCKKYESKMFAKNIQTQISMKSQSLIPFLCHSDQPLDASLVNDLVSDCGPKFEDEPELLAIVNKTQTFLCKSHEFPCMEGHSKCFNITDICSYKLNTENYLIPCRNGGHLEKCVKFECNMMFKCLNSYCIPFRYVCDGKWDCPNGDDEQEKNICFYKRQCPKMFKCRSETHNCISVGQVCDDKLDCLHHDDEMFCEFKFIQCPNSCSCLIYAITCIRLVFNNLRFGVFHLYQSVYISESNLITLNILDYKLPHVHVIHLPKNNLNSICPLLYFKNLLLIDLELNFITEIKEKCFSTSNLLKIIIISNNDIIYLDQYAFDNLYNLIFLNLSSNPLVNLPSKSFSNLLSLKSLNLQNNFFETIDPKAFISTYVKIIRTMDYKIMCVIQKETFCTSYQPWYVSCSNIIPNVFLQILYISVSIVAISLNVLSIFAQIFKFHGSQINQNFKIKESGLNLSHILCGFYLTSIWLSDILLENVYLVNEKLWQSNLLCFTEFCVALWFTISSQIILLYISVFRLKAVIDPLKAEADSFKN